MSSTCDKCHIQCNGFHVESLYINSLKGDKLTNLRSLLLCIILDETHKVYAYIYINSFRLKFFFIYVDLCLMSENQMENACYLNPYSVFEASLVFLTAVCSAKTLSSKTEKYHKKKRGTMSTQVQSNQSVQLCEQLNAANQSVCSAPLFPLWTNTFKTNDISISLCGALCFFVPLSLSSSPALWITKLICTQTLHISHSLYVY